MNHVKKNKESFLWKLFVYMNNYTFLGFVLPICTAFFTAGVIALGTYELPWDDKTQIIMACILVVSVVLSYAFHFWLSNFLIVRLCEKEGVDIMELSTNACDWPELKEPYYVMYSIGSMQAKRNLKEVLKANYPVTMASKTRKAV